MDVAFVPHVLDTCLACSAKEHPRYNEVFGGDEVAQETLQHWVSLGASARTQNKAR